MADCKSPTETRTDRNDDDDVELNVFGCWVDILGTNALSLCWAIQPGLLTPLTFARHRLSPLAAFISGAYFLYNGRR